MGKHVAIAQVVLRMLAYSCGKCGKVVVSQTDLECHPVQPTQAFYSISVQTLDKTTPTGAVTTLRAAIISKRVVWNELTSGVRSQDPLIICHAYLLHEQAQ